MAMPMTTPLGVVSEKPTRESVAARDESCERHGARPVVCAAQHRRLRTPALDPGGVHACARSVRARAQPSAHAAKDLCAMMAKKRLERCRGQKEMNFRIFARSSFLRFRIRVIYRGYIVLVVLLLSVEIVV